MIAAPTPPRPSWRVLLLAALVFVLGLLLPTWPASAVTLTAAETRVGAFDPAVAVVVGVHECITAGQRPVRGPSQPQIASGNCVAAEAGAAATSFVGRKGTTKAFDDGSSATYGGEIGIARGTNAAGEVGGRQYSGHAFDQMQGRGITPSVVDDAIQNAAPLRGADGSSIFYSGGNNISVVVNRDGRVITVGYGQFKPR